MLPVDEYVPGASLPPHLSPFVEEQQGDYVPPERRQMLEQEKQLIMNEAQNDEEDEESNETGEEKSTFERAWLTGGFVMINLIVAYTDPINI